MQTPDEVAAMLRLKGLGWGIKRIARKLGSMPHAVMVLDRAGWHRSQALVAAASITLLELPRYSPELNPVERLALSAQSLVIGLACQLSDLSAWPTSWMPVRGPGTGRHQPRPDPVALGGCLGSGFARSIGGTC